jgi:hypothetical protein
VIPPAPGFWYFDRVIKVKVRGRGREGEGPVMTVDEAVKRLRV